MHRILAPLKEAGINGINMATGNGNIHRGYPIFATFVGDYPEQILVTCLKYGEYPTCSIP